MVFNLKDIIDILLVAAILFGAYRLLRRSGAVNLFWGILLFILAWFVVSYIFHLELTGALFDRIIEVGAIALIVIFQNEIRAFFYRLGSRMSDSRVNHLMKSLVHPSTHPTLDSDDADQIVQACHHMSQTKTGALIVVTRNQSLLEYADTGEKVDASISARMIENIFFKNTPLHDGALIITGRRLISAACILPVTQNQDLPTHYGLRHRAALGLTEKTDALAIVVSEETGLITVAQANMLHTVDEEELANLLKS